MNDIKIEVRTSPTFVLDAPEELWVVVRQIGIMMCDDVEIARACDREGFLGKLVREVKLNPNLKPTVTFEQLQLLSKILQDLPPFISNLTQDLDAVQELREIIMLTMRGTEKLQLINPTAISSTIFYVDRLTPQQRLGMYYEKNLPNIGTAKSDLETTEDFLTNMGIPRFGIINNSSRII